jgi:hypothetical protein
MKYNGSQNEWQQVFSEFNFILIFCCVQFADIRLKVIEDFTRRYGSPVHITVVL